MQVELKPEWIKHLVALIEEELRRAVAGNPTVKAKSTYWVAIMRELERAIKGGK